MRCSVEKQWGVKNKITFDNEMLFQTGQITEAQNRSYENAISYLTNKSNNSPKNARLKHLIKEIKSLGNKSAIRTYEHRYINVSTSSTESSKSIKKEHKGSEFSRMITEWREHK